MNESIVMNRPGLTGYQCIAEYNEQQISDYRGNPLIEALPPLYEPDHVATLLTDFPDHSYEQRMWPTNVRMHCVQQIKRFMQPLTYHIELESCISRVIRDGYTVRNPLAPMFNRQFAVGFSSILKSGLNEAGENITGNRPSASGFAVLGMSGVGKTTALERTLLMYPQVIHHIEYSGRPLILKQLVWLKLECPGNGSMKGLCQSFFSQVDAVLGTNYYKHHVKPQTNTESLIVAMSHIAALHGLGVLVIDEIQRLSKVTSKNVMLEYFTELVNTIGIPVVVIGTYKAMPLFKSAFAEARRASGQGDHILSNLKEDDEWRLFLDSLWELQWTKNECPLTDELRSIMYEESQGIIDIAAKLYMNAQWNAILNGTEMITPEGLREVAESSLKLLRPMLKAIKLGDTNMLKNFEDLKPEWLSLNDVIRGTNTQVYGALVSEHERAIRQRHKEELLPKLMSIATQMGMVPGEAELLVYNLLKDCGSTDPTLLTQKVAQLALRSLVGTVEGQSAPSPTARTKKSGSDVRSDDPWYRVYYALKHKASVHQALLETGILKPPVNDLLAKA